jgi:hypothetical protein
LRREILEWIAHPAPHHALSVDIYNCRQNFRHRKHGGFRSRIVLGEKGLGEQQNKNGRDGALRRPPREG